MIQNVKLKIKQSEGVQEMAWKIKSASRGTDLSLRSCHCISDVMIGQVSTMTRLKGIEVDACSSTSTGCHGWRS
ncbi:unnamed protein product [Closterium sp. Yama58-4]|nr:unnamed protein product [Closterium sp. Yama58-4]